jgi:hypothetical protein
MGEAPGFRSLAMRMLKHWMGSQFARGLMLFLVLPNLAFFLLGRELFINRPLINSDYLLLWVASCYLSRRMAIGLYAGLVGLDLVLSAESIYYFSTVETILAMRNFFEFKPAISYSLAGALLVAMAAFAVGRSRSIARPKLSKRGQILVGIAALAVTGTTVARSVDLFDLHPETFGDNAIAASGVAETVLASVEFATATPQGQRIFPVKEEATSNLVRDLSRQGKSAAPYDIVLILVESEGLLKNASDMRRVLAPLIDPAIQAKYSVDTGAVRFYGPTTFGELRSLCRIYVPFAIPSKLPKLRRCLPNLLRRLGYETVSYHGFNRWFYERWNWYPTLGFQRSYFEDQMKAMSPPKCGSSAFQGVCDIWIADQVEHELSTPGTKGRRFVYWLTLNSHLPVDSALARDSSFDCTSTETLRREIGPCELARIHFQLYTRIARMALDKDIRPTRFIIVGDHMPPFPTLAERALYDNGRVPFVDLIPKGLPQARPRSPEHG